MSGRWTTADEYAGADYAADRYTDPSDAWPQADLDRLADERADLEQQQRDRVNDDRVDLDERAARARRDAARTAGSDPADGRW